MLQYALLVRGHVEIVLICGLGQGAEGWRSIHLSSACIAQVKNAESPGCGTCTASYVSRKRATAHAQAASRSQVNKNGRTHRAFINVIYKANEEFNCNFFLIALVLYSPGDM